MLDLYSRGLIVALAAACIASACALTPSRARGSNDPRLSEPSEARTIAAAGPALLSVIRDPFAEPPPRTLLPALPAEHVQRPEDVTPLPSNLSADAIPAVPGSVADTARNGPQVTAVVTGARPYAMIESSGVSEIKGIGDAVGSSAISSIDLTGVTLRNGDRLAVAPVGRP